jgi:hypothetical protein
MIVGRVVEIWRYPVKSMEGERLDACSLGELGIPGDRGWAVRDERAGEIRNARKLPHLLLCRARYETEPVGEEVPPVQIELPDGSRLRSGTSEAAERLSELLGRSVSLWPRRRADDVEHYRRGRPDQPDLEKELREVMDRLEDEPLPDFSGFPPELARFTCPPGTYFDAFPLHFLTTASLRRLEALHPGTDAHPRRFRPNLLIETNADQIGPVETGWRGRSLHVGTAELAVELPTVRCAIPARAQRGFGGDPGVLRAIVRELDQNFGSYASVRMSGRVAVGDPVELA